MTREFYEEKENSSNKNFLLSSFSILCCNVYVLKMISSKHAISARDLVYLTPVKFVMIRSVVLRRCPTDSNLKITV